MNIIVSRNVPRAAIILLQLLIVLGALSTIIAHQSPVSAQSGGESEFSRAELEMLALSPEARAIAQKLQCPVCDGQPITESNATIARQMRARVQQLVDGGDSEATILEFFEERYGPAVLREPRPAGIGLGVWVAPPIMALLGLVVIIRLLRGRRPTPVRAQLPSLSALPEDEEIVAREMNRLTGERN